MLFKTIVYVINVEEISKNLKYITGLWQMFNTPLVRFVPILFNSSHCSAYS